MALRLSGLVKPLLQHVKTIMPAARQSHLTPIAGWLEKPKSLLFHPENIMKHTEVIPIAIITFLGLISELLCTIRIAFTRDDVRFLNKVPACEQVETRVGPMYPAPIRKMYVINQKYEVPKELIAAIQSEE